MTSQKTASLLANELLGRGQVPDIAAARIDALRVLPGMSQWLRNPVGTAALLVLGDSTGWSPGTVEGSSLPAGGGYVRFVDALAQKLAASSLDMTVRLHVNDFNNGNLYYESPRVLKTANAGLRRATLPGSSNTVLYLNKSNSNKLTGIRHFFAAEVSAPNWVPANALTLFSDWTASPNICVSFGLFTDGKLWFSYSQDGTSTFNRFSTAATGLANNAIKYIGVDVQWNNGSGGNTLTFYMSDDGRNWTQLGNPVTNAGVLTPVQTTTPYQVGCRGLGGGVNANWIGGVYDIQIRKGGMYGPDILPRSPEAWGQHPGSPNVDTPFYPMSGGPQLEIVNASWPGMGLAQFDDPTNLPLLMPQYPYQAVIVNTGHNDQTFNTPRQVADKWDRLLDRITRRAPQAEIALMTQNPTLRVDGPVSNPSGPRDLHTQRMGWLAAYARSRGVSIIDTYQTFADWPLSGGAAALGDLLDPAGAGTGQEIHPMGPGVTRQTQKVYDEVFAQ